MAVDALRGLAAFAVVLYHVNAAFSRAPQPWMPAALQDVLRQGHFGVDVFFVLSGFVIAFSVRQGRWTPGYLARFALRRSIRLDPPYWAAIALESGLIIVGALLIPSLSAPVPTLPQVASHLFYAQGFLGYDNIIPIFWTLCYEFQFYLTFVALLVAWATLRRRVGERTANGVTAAAALGLFATSVAVHHGWMPTPLRGLALDRWHQFFVGVLSWGVVAGLVSPWLLAGAFLAMAAGARRPDFPIEFPILVLTSLVCILSARSSRFDARFRARPLQFLGLISYSLYLYHASVGWRAVALAQRLWGPTLPPALGVTTWMVAVLLAVGVAGAGWWLLERPFQRLARHVRLPAEVPPAAVDRLNAA
jgi:peptidoglycan/LPS O-acetylase OafA/YrhL